MMTSSFCTGEKRRRRKCRLVCLLRVWRRLKGRGDTVVKRCKIRQKISRIFFDKKYFPSNKKGFKLKFLGTDLLVRKLSVCAVLPLVVIQNKASLEESIKRYPKQQRMQARRESWYEWRSWLSPPIARTILHRQKKICTSA